MSIFNGFRLDKNCTKKAGVMCELYYFLRALWSDFIRGDITVRAMSMVYITLLSLIPLLALSFSILKTFGVHNRIQPALLQLLKPLGNKGVEITNTIVSFVSNVDVGVLGAVGLAVLVYTSISLMNKIEEALNFTWEVSSSRHIVSRIRRYFSFIFLGPILLFSAVGLWFSLLDNAWVKALVSLETVGPVISLITLHFSKLIAAIGFTLVYLLIPNVRVSFKAAFLGGLIAAFLWQMTGNIFAAFVVNSNTQAVIYSAFASLLVFMLWLYASWLILLFGSRIAFYIQHPQQAHYSHHATSLSPELYETISFAVMKNITSRFYQQLEPLDLLGLSEKQQIPSTVMRDIVDTLQSHRFITENAEHPPQYILCCAADEITIGELKRAIAKGDKNQQALTQSLLKENTSLATLYTEQQNQQDQMSLKDFAIPK